MTAPLTPTQWLTLATAIGLVLILALLPPRATRTTQHDTPPATTQAPTLTKWEYLVVTYGATRFTTTALENDPTRSGLSKVMHFGDAGITLPAEALSLQRNLDVLGRYGWELVTALGTISGDQQLLLKRPYDPQRSAHERDRIREERSDTPTRTALPDSLTNDTDPPQAQDLQDLDEIEATNQALERTQRAETTLRAIIHDAAQRGYPLHSVTITDRTTRAGPTRLNVTITQDVTNAAYLGNGQYRSSHAQHALAAFHESLTWSGLHDAPHALCTRSRATAEITLHGIIITTNDTHTVATRSSVHCFDIDD
jgi:hypothetical protein